MKLKYSGLTASGKTRTKFMRGDIYRDQYGGTVMIKGVVHSVYQAQFKSCPAY